MWTMIATMALLVLGCLAVEARGRNTKAQFGRVAAGCAGCAGTCVKKVDGFTCGCKNGFVLGRDQRSCIVHPCDRRDRGGCGGSCIRKGEGLQFTCGCRLGYTLDLDAVTCRKEHACDRQNAGCVHICKRNGDLYTCLCSKGYLLKKDGKSCARTGPVLSALRGVRINLKVIHIEPQREGYGRARRTVVQVTQSPWYIMHGKKKVPNVIKALLSELKIVPRDCYATPTSKRADPRRVYLIKNGFTKDETFIHGTANSHMFSFSVKPLAASQKKGESPLKYLHCTATVCRREDNTRMCTFNKANVGLGNGRLHYVVRATTRL